VKKIAVLIVLALVLFVANHAAYAHSNLLPAVKVGGGWVSVVSYVNTQAPNLLINPAVYVHATYQMKDPADLTAPCVHLDAPSLTSQNDLTTSKLNALGGGPGFVFPVGDTMGSAILLPPDLGFATSEGFLVLENYDGANVMGADGTLTTEAIIFNLSTGFLYSERGLSTSHIAPSSTGGNVSIEAPGCGNCNYMQASPFSNGAATVFGNTSGGTLTRFMFLPPAKATTGAYVIATNRAGTAEGFQTASTLNLVSPGTAYDATILMQARRDAAQGYQLGVYNRLEQNQSVVVDNDVVCLASLTPEQLVGTTNATFIANGGWVNLSPRCVEDELVSGLTVCDGNGAGEELGDSAVLYKTEFAAGYGFAITPQHQQWFAK
jgi:hypothetical protein